MVEVQPATTPSGVRDPCWLHRLPGNIRKTLSYSIFIRGELKNLEILILEKHVMFPAVYRIIKSVATTTVERATTPYTRSTDI
jgi:hypothetical protein